MKNLKTGILCLLLTLCYITSSAQIPPVNEPNPNKPSLFQDLPARLNLRLTVLETLLDQQVGQTINVMVASNFVFTGQIVSKSDAQDVHVRSVVVKSTNRQGANLTFTQIKNSDGTSKYLGRIISRQHGDSFEIISENGEYYFMKKGFYDLVNE